jgi:hypothetical protein
MTVIRKILGIVGFGGMGVSVMVYLTSFFGFTFANHPVLFVSLHGGVFVLLAPMFLVDYSSLRNMVFFWKVFGAAMPSWAIPTLKILGGLAIAHFILFLLLTHATSPTVKDGQYVLDDHGRTIRVLSQEEYLRFKGWELRMFAAYWTFFYAVPALYWWFPRGSKTELRTQTSLSA